MVVERAKPGTPAEGLGTVPSGKGIFVAVCFPVHRIFRVASEKRERIADTIQNRTVTFVSAQPLN